MVIDDDMHATMGASVRERFIERMGLLAQADGLPRIAGRLMALLVLEGGPLAFADLARRLQVSRGSISSNARLLESMGAIERVTKPGERGDFFQLAPDPYVRLLNGVEQRALKSHDLARETRDALSREGVEGATLERLADLENFYGALARAVTSLRKELS